MVFFCLCLWVKPYHKLGRIGFTLLSAILLIIILLPVDMYVLGPLEGRFPQPKQLPKKVDGVIALGGAVNVRATRSHSQLSLNSQAERLTEFLALAKKYPNAVICYSGGSGYFFQHRPKEASLFEKFVAGFSIKKEKIVFETESGNTFENVKFSKEKIKPQPNET